jgi:hypothetical protein
MDSYRRVVKPRTEEPIKENEVRITTQGVMRSYISYAIALFKVCVSFESFQSLYLERVTVFHYHFIFGIFYC